MYVGVDIGGSKTLVALLTSDGQIEAKRRFKTPHNYQDFKQQLARELSELKHHRLTAACVGVPGLLNRKAGVTEALGNLKWHNIPIRDDVQSMLTKNVPVLIENDARLAGLSEAQLVKHHARVLYLTISTGIGAGFIKDGRIVRALEDNEVGKIPLLHQGKYVHWEDFASGRAIVAKYHKKAFEINDTATWETIGHNIAQGLGILCSIMQPQIIIFGGSVGVQADKFTGYLGTFLRNHLHDIVRQPEAIIPAQRPEEAVIFGCYDLAKQVHGAAT